MAIFSTCSTQTHTSVVPSKCRLIPRTLPTSDTFETTQNELGAFLGFHEYCALGAGSFSALTRS